MDAHRFEIFSGEIMRARTNISTKERRQFVLSDFRGADFSNSTLRVQSNRAVEMSNFINDYGMNRKRNGWCQIWPKFEGRINGIVSYKNGDATEFLVYAGTTFWRWNYEENMWYNVTTSSSRELFLVDETRLKDQRVQFFFNKGLIYIVGCGDLLCYGNFAEEVSLPLWELRTVGVFTSKTDIGIANVHCKYDTDFTGFPYIPTTTISIDSTTVLDAARARLDQVNLLTNWRKNTLVGSSDAGGTYRLDGNIIPGHLVIKLTYEDNEGYYVASVYRGTTEVIDLIGGAKYAIVDETNAYVGWYRDDVLELGNAPPINEGEANIVVWFAADMIESYFERTRNCSIGTTFGIGGNDDRLFLSGNSELANVEFFSEVDDFTNFPDQFTATLGTDRSEITGFLRMSDNTLAIFKRPYGNETSVYFQSGEYRNAYDSAGNLQKMTPVFSVTAGATSESAVNPYVCANFSGDNMILSKNGVFSIELTENVATNTRTARERSRAINARLCKQNGIVDAVGIVYRGKYYLAMDDVCYVADARYKYQSEDSADYNYEWWYWTNIPARVWAVINDELWFGTEDGRICKFDDAFSDRRFDLTESGNIGFDDNKFDRFSFNPKYISLRENDRIVIQTDGVFAVYLDLAADKYFSFDKEGRIFAGPDYIKNVFDGEIVYADATFNETHPVPEGVELIVSDVDRAACSFLLKYNSGTHSGEVVKLKEGMTDFRLLRSISNKQVYVTDVDTEENTFSVKLTKDGEALTITDYLQPIPLEPDKGEITVVPTNPIAQIWHYENVVAKWYTPLFDFGTNEASKTLLKLTVSTEPQTGGRLNFGYETRTSYKDFLAHGTQRFSFDDFDFSNFSFETGFANSYSVKVKERNFNFISFRFISDNDKNCTINDFTVTYKINKRNLEVR